MTDQIILFALLFTVFVLLIWGRWRYDIVAFAALIVAVLTGIVPKELAFSGFGHPRYDYHRFGADRESRPVQLRCDRTAGTLRRRRLKATRHTYCDDVYFSGRAVGDYE